MKKIFIVILSLLVLLLFSSCTNKKENKNSTKKNMIIKYNPKADREDIKYYDDGKKRIVNGFKKNKNGDEFRVYQKNFYKNGNKKGIVYFNDKNQKHGECMGWFPSGKKYFQYNYKNGLILSDFIYMSK